MKFFKTIFKAMRFLAKAIWFLAKTTWFCMFSFIVFSIARDLIEEQIEKHRKKLKND